MLLVCSQNHVCTCNSYVFCFSSLTSWFLYFLPCCCLDTDLWIFNVIGFQLFAYHIGLFSIIVTLITFAIEFNFKWVHSFKFQLVPFMFFCCIWLVLKLQTSIPTYQFIVKHHIVLSSMLHIELLILPLNEFQNIECKQLLKSMPFIWLSSSRIHKT